MGHISKTVLEMYSGWQSKWSYHITMRLWIRSLCNIECLELCNNYI